MNEAHYSNSRVVVVGDLAVGRTVAGIVGRIEKDNTVVILGYQERKNGEPYNLIPVTVEGRHWEPQSTLVAAQDCIHLEDVSSQLQHKEQAYQAIKAAFDELEKQYVALAGGAPAPASAVDPNQNELSLPEAGKAQASLSTPNAGATDSAAAGTNGTNNANAS